MNIEQTYKMHIYKEMLMQELVDLKEWKDGLLTNKTIRRKTVEKITVYLILLVPAFLMFMNFLVASFDWTVIFYLPLYVFQASLYIAPILGVIFVYNKVVKKSNLHLSKTIEKDLLLYKQNKSAIQNNLQVAEQALMNKSKVPAKYQSEQSLEVMIDYMKSGKATNDGEAFRLYFVNYVADAL